MDFMRGLYGNQKTFEIKSIPKAPADMPPDTPYVSYQGREPGSPTVQIIWISTATANSRDEENTQGVEDEYVAATALAVMDAGNAGPTLQTLYAKTPNDRKAHLALGLSFAQAWHAASDQSAAFAAGQATWVQTHVIPGMTRSAAYDLVKIKGLTAYNYSFIKGKAIPPQSDSTGHVITGGGCDMSDKSSAAWPYQGELVPSREGACAEYFASKPKSIPNPDAELNLPGAFNIACGWSTRIVITFTEADRVKAVDIGQPRSTCL